MKQIVWFRRDLRLHDHPALTLACSEGAVLPVFILDPALLHHPETGVARVEFLLATLRSLDHDLRARGGRLLVRQGEPAAVLRSLALSSGADGVVAHVDSERIVGRVRDGRVSRCLAEAGVPLRWIEPPGATGALLSYPEYRRSWHRVMGEPPIGAPARIQVPEAPAAGSALADLPIPGLAELGLMPDGKPIPPAGSDAALALLERFCGGPAARSYYWQLSYPAARSTTGLSPYLKFGVLTARQCLDVLRRRMVEGAAGDPGVQRSHRQLVNRLRWGAGMAQRFRYLPQLELRPLWSCFDDPEAEQLREEQVILYEAWRSGRTGFPIVDAAARALRAEGGWRDLNFRSRAISASFLTNLCGIDWRYGALHFMRHLLDGDCPIDHYQWAMQAGATSAGPEGFTRIYHPGQTAVERCDPQGVFIRRWLPELASLTNDQLGQPPPMTDYPRPVLGYEDARRRRLEHLARRKVRQGDDRLEGLSRLPTDLTPFAAAQFPQLSLAWTSAADRDLVPAPLDLDHLDDAQRRALASWFVSGEPRRHRSGRGKTGPPRPLQLELWDQP